jgi:cell division GTPase FtsZ
MARKKRIDFNSINLQAMESFQDEIETIRKGSDSYIDAIIQYCSQNNLDVDDVLSVISENLTDKIRIEEIANRSIKDDTVLDVSIWA